MKLKLALLGLGIIHVCALVPPLVASRMIGEGRRRDFDIKARQYAYDPPRIVVDKGDEVHIKLASLDVVHGFFLEGYDIDALIEPGKLGFKVRKPSEGKEHVPAKEIVFIADRPGKYRYRCSHTCGTLHPFMQGEMIVRPNYAFLAGIGGTVGIFLATFIVLFLGGKSAKRASSSPAEAGA